MTIKQIMLGINPFDNLASHIILFSENYSFKKINQFIKNLKIVVNFLVGKIQIIQT